MGNFDITIPYAKTMEFDQDTLSYQMWIDVSGERVLLYEGNIKNQQGYEMTIYKPENMQELINLVKMKTW